MTGGQSDNTGNAATLAYKSDTIYEYIPTSRFKAVGKDLQRVEIDICKILDKI